MKDIKVPVLPESVSDATVALWHKKPGDTVRVDEVIVEIETDKVVLEVPSEANGELKEIIEKQGALVKAEQLLGRMIEKDLKDDIKDKTTNLDSKAEEKAINKQVKEQISKVAGPAVRKIMAEKNLTRDEVSGSGKAGRILKEDVLSQSQNETFKTSKLNVKDRIERRVPMSRLRSRISERLLNATQSTAMLTTFNELDMSAVINIRNKYKEEFEKTHNIKLGFMSFFVKAAVEALKKFPAVNAYIDGNDIVYHGFCDVGIAVSSDRGLVVPVLKDAHDMNLYQIESSIFDFSMKAKNGKLTIDEITGGTFTISNGGVFGSMLSTPIINPPQSAILGMHATKDRPVAVNGEIAIRPVMYLALSYDHRIIDGKEAVLFLRSIKENLEDPSRLLLSL